MAGKNILYIHGMGGGGDSRIPSILRTRLKVIRPDLKVIVRTYNFDPDIAMVQLDRWFDELRPELVIGESLGANLALELLADRTRKGEAFPLLLVSPATGAPKLFSSFAWITRIPGVTSILDRIFKPADGDRQEIHFAYGIMKNWKSHLERTYEARGNIHAFFGKSDHYRKYGIVSPARWKRRFGESGMTLYDGTHYMEEPFIQTLLIPAIIAQNNLDA